MDKKDKSTAKRAKDEIDTQQPREKLIRYPTCKQKIGNLLDKKERLYFNPKASASGSRIKRLNLFAYPKNELFKPRSIAMNTKVTSQKDLSEVKEGQSPIPERGPKRIRFSGIEDESI